MEIRRTDGMVEIWTDTAHPWEHCVGAGPTLVAAQQNAIEGILQELNEVLGLKESGDVVAT